jgi:hypothetical protein
MGGDLVAESDGLGRGTIVTFTIPLCPASRDDVSTPSSRTASCAAASSALLDAVAAAALSPRGGAARATPLERTISSSAAASDGRGSAVLHPPRWQPTAISIPHSGGGDDSPPPPLTLPSPRAVGSDSFVLPPLVLSPPPSPSSPSPTNVNVLVAEDDALCQAVMRKILGRLGVRFTLVGNGAAAVAAYKEGACATLATLQHSFLCRRLTERLRLPPPGEYDLVLMDLHMCVPARCTCN